MNKAAVRYISVGQSFKANGICYKAVCNGSDIGDRGIVTCVAKRDYKRWLRAALFKHPWAGEQFQYPGKDERVYTRKKRSLEVEIPYGGLTPTGVIHISGVDGDINLKNFGMVTIGGNKFRVVQKRNFELWNHMSLQDISLTVAKVENHLIPVEEFGISDGINLTDEGLYDFIKERSNT